MAKDRKRLTPKEKAKLDIYLKIYDESKKWEVVKKYAVEGESMDEIKKWLENKKNQDVKKYSTDKQTISKRCQRWTEKLKKEKSKIILDGTENKNHVIEYILDCYPEAGFFQEEYDYEEEWTPKKMQEAFKKPRKVRIGENNYIFPELNYSEKDYEEGILQYIEKQKREIIGEKEPAKNISHVYFWDISGSLKACNEINLYSDRGIYLGYYTLKLKNLYNKEWTDEFNLKAPVYVDTRRYYKSEKKKEEDKKKKNELYGIFSQKYMYDYTRYPFTYIAVLCSEQKEKEDSLRKELIRSWKDFNSFFKRKIEKNNKKEDNVRKIRGNKYLYIRLGKNYFILAESVKNAKLAKEWQTVAEMEFFS